MACTKVQVPPLTLLPLQEAGELGRGSVTVAESALPEKMGKIGIELHVECLPSMCEKQTHTYTHKETHIGRDTYTNTHRHSFPVS